MFAARNMAFAGVSDGLSLDLQFATDKTLTARKGPTPVFTRASTATFVGSDGLIQSAAINEPRFDHDPVTLACKGLLIEESRTNFVFNSDLYTSSTATNITATTIAGTSVTGSNQIRELSLTASGSLTGVQANIAGTGTGIKTLSVFIKKPTSNASPYFTIGFASSALVYAGIQLTMSGSTPVISVTSTSNTFAVVSSSLETFPNGWYRVSVVVSGTATTCFPTMYPSNAVWDGISDIRQALTASGTNLIYVFGAQVEAGSFATSYIPTTTASVVRSVDVCSITGSDFTGFYNNDQGTIVTVASANGFTSSNNAIVSIESGTSAVFRLFNRVAQGNRLSALITSAPTLTPASNYNTANVVYKSAITADATGADFIIDGTQIPDTFTGYVLTADKLKFSGVTASTSNTTISSLRYYKKRLATAKLVSLTS